MVPAAVAASVTPADSGESLDARRVGLADDLARVLVVAEPEEARLADDPFEGPFGERDLAHELGSHPARRAPHRRRRWGIERALVGGEPPKLGEERLEQLAVEPCAHAAGEVQPGTVVVAEQHGRERVLTRAGAPGPAADHELLLAPHLDLAPRRRALAGLVRAAEPLGHDAFELAFTGGVEQLPAAADVMGGDDPVIARCDDIGEEPAPVLVGQAHGLA